MLAPSSPAHNPLANDHKTSTAFSARSAYLQKVDEVTQALRVIPSQGLSDTEVTKRRARSGANQIPAAATHPLWHLLFDRFRDLLVILLSIAAIISLLIGEKADALIIALAIFLDFILSFIQVWRTEHTLQKLRQSVEHLTTVIRNGKASQIPSSYLVVGDIIVFRAGEKIPADARVITSNGLQVAEGTLTGESLDVHKQPDRLLSRTPLASQRNMVFLGTVVTHGSGKAVVTAIGTRTEFGKIAQLLKTQPSPRSPLRHKLQRLGLMIAGTICVLVFGIVGLSLLQGADIGTTLHTAITLIVSAIPEDLTVILTIALTVGMVRILRHRGVVRELSSAETLGAATVICTDKTGTLTKGEMQAKLFDSLQGSVLAPGDSTSEPFTTLALTTFALATDAHRLSPTSADYFGSATERVALGFMEQFGLSQEKLKEQWRRRDSINFDSRWKYRATLNDHPTRQSRTIFVMGAPEVLLEKSSQALSADHQATPLTSERRFELAQQLHDHASRGERLLAVAIRRNYERSEITHSDVVDLLFLGVLVITDPIREDVRASIAETQSAGIAVKIVTGDLEATARAIARDCGLTVPDDSVCSGEMLEDLSDDELRQRLDRTIIFARVTPIDKQRIIRLLQEQGHVVAMTGDGVNDAVALKAADIGVAMGSGKDIAKDAADLVLLDNSFATIVAAIREGRVIRDNVRKVIAFLLATNAAEVALFIVSVLLKWPLPLLPAQILWINLVTDGTSDIALSFEPGERNVMRRLPENPQTMLLNRPLVLHILYTGGVTTAVALLIYWYTWRYLALDLAYTQTMIFTFVSVSSLFSTWSFRSLTEPIYRRGLWQNPWIILSAAFSFVLQLGAIYLPTLQRFFGTVPLDAYDWVLIIVATVVTLTLIELRKLVPLPAAALARK